MKIIIFVFLLLVSSFSFAADVYVRSYNNGVGAYVQPYYRTNPNIIPYDNFSTVGNITPYTNPPSLINPYSTAVPSYGTNYSSRVTYQERENQNSQTTYMGPAVSSQQSYVSTNQIYPSTNPELGQGYSQSYTNGVHLYRTNSESNRYSHRYQHEGKCYQCSAEVSQCSQNREDEIYF